MIFVKKKYFKPVKKKLLKMSDMDEEVHYYDDVCEEDSENPEDDSEDSEDEEEQTTLGKRHRAGNSEGPNKQSRTVTAPPSTPTLDDYANRLLDDNDIPKPTLFDMGNELIEKWITFVGHQHDKLQCAYDLYELERSEHHEMDVLASKLRAYRTPAVTLYLRYMIENIVQEDENNVVSEISQRFTRVVHVMQYMHDLIRSDQLAQNFSNLNVDFGMSTNMSFYKFKLNTSGTEFSPYQELLRYLLSEAYQRGYRKKNDCLYKQIILNGQDRTHAWEKAMTMKEFLYEATKKEISPDQWYNLTKGRANVTAACEYLEHSRDFEIPMLESNRYLFSFQNALYDAKNNELHQYGSSSTIPPKWVSANFIEQPVPENLTEMLDDQKFDIWRHIDTPYTDIVLKSQRIHQQIRAKKGRFAGDFVNAQRENWKQWYWGHVINIYDSNGDRCTGDDVPTSATFDVDMVLEKNNLFSVVVDDEELLVEVERVKVKHRIFQVRVLSTTDVDEIDEILGDEDSDDEDNRLFDEVSTWLSTFRSCQACEAVTGDAVLVETEKGTFVGGSVTHVAAEETCTVYTVTTETGDIDARRVYSDTLNFAVQDWWCEDDRPCTLKWLRQEKDKTTMLLDLHKNARYVAEEIPFKLLHATPLDWTYAFVGRMLYELNVFDQWSVVPFLKGKAGTGKSTLAKLVSWFYASHNVGILSNNSEAKFGLSAIYECLIWLCMEVKSDMQLSQSEFQSMVSGENMNIPVKNKTAKSNVLWNAPGMLCGNESAPWCDAAGSIDRRVLWILFNYSIPSGKSDMNLDKKLKSELGSIIIKCNCVYRQFADLFGRKSVWNSIPKWFLENSRKLRAETQPIAAFLEEDETLEIGKKYYMPLKDFRDMFKDYTQMVGMGKVKWNKNLYDTCFEKENLRVEKSSKPWPPSDGDVEVEKRWVIGIGPRDEFDSL